MSAGGVGRSQKRLQDCPGFLRAWTASTVAGFGTCVTTLAIQALVVLTPQEGAAGVDWSIRRAGFPICCRAATGVLLDRSRRRPLLVAIDLGPGR
jgi:hypothetical protein